MSEEKHVFAGVDCTKIINDFKKRMEEDEKYRKRIEEEINGIDPEKQFFIIGPV